MELDSITVLLKPFPNGRPSVIRSIIENQVYFPDLVLPEQLLEKSQEVVRVEPVHETEMEFGFVTNRNRTHDLQAFLGGRGLDVATDPSQSPVPINRTCLLEACFIQVYQDPSVFLGFFLYQATPP